MHTTYIHTYIHTYTHTHTHTHIHLMVQIQIVRLEILNDYRGTACPVWAHNQVYNPLLFLLNKFVTLPKVILGHLVSFINAQPPLTHAFPQECIDLISAMGVARASERTNLEEATLILRTDHNVHIIHIYPSKQHIPKQTY
jgi:hypothetical protein